MDNTAHVEHELRYKLVDRIQKIQRLASSLGLSETDRHEKSITVSAMETLARY